MKKKWMMAAGLCVFIITAGIGCGAKNEEPQAVTVEETGTSESEQTQKNEISQDGESTKENSQIQDSEKVNVDEPVEDGGLTDLSRGEKSAEKLEGNVKSIDDGSVVIIKTIIEERDDESQVMIGVAPGYEAEEDLVNVNFQEITEYELRTVKNGGVNPDEDVTVKKASFSDMKDGASISLEGYYEGDTFVAEKVVLYEFV